MDLQLVGKVVLITGGSRGIGLACARGFAAEGARLVLCARDEARLRSAAASLPDAHAYAADLRDAAAAQSLVETVEVQVGPIDVLVNSAGAARRTPPEELTPAAWHAAMDAKYFSYIHVIDPVVKRMVARGRGVIVNITGQGGKLASASHIAGGAANAALMLATAGLGNAFAGKGVRVLGVSPALTDTDRVAEGMQAAARMAGVSLEEARRRSVAALPMGRMATPEEIANAVVFLASPRASYVSGVTLGVDGGFCPVVL